MGWMDVLISVICVINSIKGWMKGWFASAFQVGGFLIAGIAAKKYYSVVSTFLLEQPIFLNLIQGQISNRLQSSSNLQAVPGSIVAEQSIFQRLNFPQWMEKWLMENETVKVYGAEAIEGTVSFFSGMLTEIVVDFLSIFLVFAGAKVILSIIGHLLNPIGKHSIFKRWNQFGGLLFGLVKGLLIVFILFGLLVPILAVTGNPVLIEGLENSVFARIIYDYNPIARVIQGRI